MKRFLTRLIPVMMILFIVPAGLFPQQKTKPVIRYDRDSRYYRIIVTDHPDLGRRVLEFSKTRGAQSSMLLDRPNTLALSYLRTLMASFALHEKPSKVLLVGLGGAAIPKFLAEHYPDIRLDIVEIDPDVIKVAQEYFFFKPTKNMRLFAIDGRLYMKQSTDKYDIIILDAYASDSLPFHLTTVEFFRLVKERLNPDGVIAANLWEYFVNKFFMSELRTVREVFPTMYLFSTPDPASKVLFAGMKKSVVQEEDWALRAEKFIGSRDTGYNLPELIRREYADYTSRAIRETVLTDDKAPVDLLRTKKAE